MKSTIREKIEDNLNSQNDNILFILQNKQTSFDNDFYCVFAGITSSKVLFFTDESGIWNEIFVDNTKDLNYKLDNYDEIILNFLSQMTFIEGDIEMYEKYRKLALIKKVNYVYPADRIWKLKYRISTLFSKYKEYKEELDDVQSKFILNTLNYPFIQIILITNKIVPASPKNWISQLKEILDENEFNIVSSLILQTIQLNELQFLYDKYIGKLENKILNRGKKCLTFIN